MTSHLQLTLLSSPPQFMRFCEKCDSEQIFMAGWECRQGLLGYCLGCGDESVIPYSRANSDAA